MTARSAASDRAGALLALSLPLTALAATTSFADVFNVAKYAALGIVAAGLLGLVAYRSVTERRSFIEPTPYVGAVAVFVVLFGVAAALAPDALRAMFGARNRFDGFLLYTALGLLSVVASNATTTGRLRLIHRTLIALGLGLALYGVVDAIGADPFSLPAAARGADATFGNSNFLSGYLAICGVPVAAAALGAAEGTDLRLAALGGLMLIAVGIIASTASQGLFALPAGVAIVLIAWLRDKPTTYRRRGTAALVVAGAVLAAVFVLSNAGVAPFDALRVDRALSARVGFWQTAGSMAVEEPLTGVGPGEFGLTFREHRPVSAVVRADVEATNDAAHNVPLHFAATGGIGVALSYLVVMGFGAWATARGFRAFGGAKLMLFAGLAGAWVAYQVQSMVSIDVIPLATAGWVLNGLLVGAVLPSTAVRRQTAHPLPIRLAASVLGAGLALGVLVVWLRPAVVERRVQAAVVASQRGDTSGTLDAIAAAADLGAYEPSYRHQHAQFAVQQGDPATGVDLYELAVEAGHGYFPSASAAAPLADGLGDVDRAAELYGIAYDAEPLHPAFAFDYASFLLRNDRRDEGVAVIDAALDNFPDDGPLLLLRETVPSD